MTSIVAVYIANLQLIDEEFRIANIKNNHMHGGMYN